MFIIRLYRTSIKEPLLVLRWVKFQKIKVFVTINSTLLVFSEVWIHLLCYWLIYWLISIDQSIYNVCWYILFSRLGVDTWFTAANGEMLEYLGTNSQTPGHCTCSLTDDCAGGDTCNCDNSKCILLLLSDIMVYISLFGAQSGI